MGIIAVPSGTGLLIFSNFLFPVRLGAFSKLRNHSHGIHICGKATLWDYLVVNYQLQRGYFAGRMGLHLRWSLPVTGLKGVCTLLVPTAIPALALHANGLHQYSFIFGRKNVSSSAGTDEKYGFVSYFMSRSKMFPKGECKKKFFTVRW